MRWLTVFCATLTFAAVGVHGQEEFEDLGLVPGLIRAAAAPPPPSGQQHDQGGGNQGQASGGQTHGGSGGKAVQAADSNNGSNGNNKNGSKGAKAGDAHEAGKSGAHDKAPTSTSKDGAHHGDTKDGHADKKSDSGHGKDDSDHKSKNKPSKTRKLSEDDEDDEGDDEAEKEYLKRVKADKDAGKLPGRMKMVVPPRTVHTPLFELDSVVELKWEYDNNVIEVPEKLMISVQLPKDPHDPSAKPVIYDIAANVTGEKKSFFWDTKNDVPEGVGMREGSGYTMFFYDGDIGFRMSDVVPAGYLIKYAMPFAFYISRYERTNDGVPRNFNPNAAARPVPAIGLTALLLLVASAVAHCWIG